MDVIFTKQQREKLEEWEFILRNYSDFVRIDKVNGIKFEIRTDEKGSHHKPYLHISTSCAALSIAIENGEILAKSGKISPPQLKKAQKWIAENRDIIIDKWNEFSNGIKIEVTQRG